MDATVPTPIKCKYPTYDCNSTAEKKFGHCLKHILKDPSTKASKEYTNCSFISINGNSCPNIRPIDTTTPYCHEHSRMNQINKMKAAIGRKKQLDSSEIIVSNLSHYLQNEKSKPQSTTKIGEDDEIAEEICVTSNVDPFFEINANDMNGRGRKILDYASDDSPEEDSEFSDTPITTLSNTWFNEIDNSDDESVDSEGDTDLLKHAGILQIEEIVKLSKEKMQRLQSLYIDQFQKLQRVLKDKRKNYIQSLKKEKEVHSNIYDQYKDSPRERKLYAKFKAMNHYHQRKHGVEAILYRKFLEKRQQAEQSQANVPLNQQKNVPKCSFSDGVKCLERPLVHNKYCRKHIMEDKKQILFKSCGIDKSGIVCQEPVVNIFEDSACVLHTSLYQLPRIYVKKKYESETEEEDTSMKVIKEKDDEDIKPKVEEICTNEVECVADDEDIKIN